MLGRYVHLKGENKEQFEDYIVALYTSGLSKYKISAETGRSTGAVLKVLKAREVPMRKKGTPCQHKGTGQVKGRKIGPMGQDGWKSIVCLNCNEVI